MPGSGQSTAAKRNEPDLLTAGSEVTAVEEQEHTRQAKEPKLSDAMMNYLALMVQMEAAGIRLRSIDIANRMGVKKPSVCNALEKLAENGCVISCNGRDIVLTQKGRDLGAIFWEKARILSGMLEAGVWKKRPQRNRHSAWPTRSAPMPSTPCCGSPGNHSGRTRIREGRHEIVELRNGIISVGIGLDGHSGADRCRDAGGKKMPLESLPQDAAPRPEKEEKSQK